MEEEIKAKKKLPIWALITGAALLIAAVAIIVMLVSGSSPAKRVAKKLELADCYMAELKYEEAIALYNEVLEIDPKNIKAYAGLFDAYIATDDETKAREIIALAEGVVSSNTISEFYQVLDEKYNNQEVDAVQEDLKEVSENSENSDFPREEIKYSEDGSYEIEEYDKNGLLFKNTHYKADGILDYWTEFEYGEGNILITSTDYYSSGAYYTSEYDVNGNRIKASVYGINGELGFWWTYEYDANGILLRETYNTVEYKQYSITEYDSAGRITEYAWYQADGSFISKYKVTEYNADGSEYKGIEYNEDGSIKSYYRKTSGRTEFSNIPFE